MQDTWRALNFSCSIYGIWLMGVAGCGWGAMSDDLRVICLKLNISTLGIFPVWFLTTVTLGGVQRGRFVNAKSASQEAPMHSLDRKRSEYDCIR